MYCHQYILIHVFARVRYGVEASMVMQWTVNPPSLTRLVRSQDAPPILNTVSC